MIPSNINGQLKDYDNLDIWCNFKNYDNKGIRNVLIDNNNNKIVSTNTNLSTIDESNNSIYFQDSLTDSTDSRYFVIENNGEIIRTEPFNYITSGRKTQVPGNISNFIFEEQSQNQLRFNWDAVDYAEKYIIRIERVTFYDSVIGFNYWQLYMDKTNVFEDDDDRQYWVTETTSTSFSHQFIDDVVNVTYKVIPCNDTYRYYPNPSLMKMITKQIGKMMNQLMLRIITPRRDQH